MDATVANPTRVAAVTWDGMDLTDFTGPVEVLSHARNESRQRLVNLTVAAETPSILTSQGVRIERGVTIDTLLEQLDSIDILLIPGGGGTTAEKIPTAPGLVQVLEAFIKLPPRKEGGPRILMSICAGAFWLVQAGLLTGRVATTHYAILGELKKLADRHGKNTTVVRQHYVDSGVDEEKGLHIIMGGGITSGFDSTLYLLEKKFGPDVAARAQAILDYSWRKEMTPFGIVS